LGEGSFSIEVNEDGTQVTTRLGEAQLIAADTVVSLAAGERSMVSPGEAPSSPLPAEQNLLVNGDFSEPLDGVWDVYKVEPPSGAVTTAVEIFEVGNRNVLEFNSQGEDNLHSEVGIIQEIDKSVQDFDSLRVHLEVRLERQSLPGGGTLGSEFPIMVHLAYKDANGSDRDWYRGFYYVPPPEDWLLFDTPDNSSERVARFLWYPYESVNLLDSLGTEKPVDIKYIRIYASGWIYQARIAAGFTKHALPILHSWPKTSGLDGRKLLLWRKNCPSKGSQHRTSSDYEQRAIPLRSCPGLFLGSGRVSASSPWSSL
jgi:hypothetical protein